MAKIQSVEPNVADLANGWLNRINLIINWNRNR